MSAASVHSASVHAKFFPVRPNIVPRERIYGIRPVTAAEAYARKLDRWQPFPALVVSWVEKPKLADQIIREVCEKYGVTETAVKAPIRSHYLNAPRREIAVRLRELGWSAPRIGQIMHRDHTSILNWLLLTKSSRERAARKRLAPSGG